MTSIQYSVVIPVFKTVETLEPLFNQIKEVMNQLGKTYEVIFVEDYGDERSWAKLLELKSRNTDRIRIIRLTRNFGQNGATLCGIDEAKGQKVITIDDDLQIAPKEILKLISFQEGNNADVVYGKMPKGQTSWMREVGGRMVKRLFNKNEGGTSIGSSFRLIDTHIVEKLRFHSQDHLFINQVISWYTLDTQFVEVEHQLRQEGRSGYSLWSLMLLSFRLIIYYTTIPLKILIFLCAVTALSCLLIGAYYFQNEPLMILLFLSVGLILGSVSVLGIYINRIYKARVRKPNYSIKIKL